MTPIEGYGESSDAGGAPGGVKDPGAPRRRRRRQRSTGPGRGTGTWLERLWMPLLAFLILFVVVTGYLRLSNRGRIQPGVTIAGVDVGGMPPADALDTVIDSGMDPQAPVTLRAASAEWSLDPAEAGLELDARATVAEAYAVGRRGSFPRALRAIVGARLRGRDVQPVVLADHDRVRHAMEGVADTFDRPADDASLAIDGTTVRQTPAAPGQAINVDGAIAAVMAEAGAGRWPIQGIELPHFAIEPAVTDASEAMDAADALLAADVVLDLEENEWRLSPETLGPMLTTTRVDRTVALDIDRERFAQWLAPAADVVSRTAQLPRFHFDDAADELVLVEPGLTERRLDIDSTVAHVLQAGRTGMRHTTVGVNERPLPIPDDVRAADLGIRELIREETSHYVGSAAGRIHNVGLATSKFDGILIEPGAVFSFNDVIGEITPEEGYEETLIIMDGATTDGVGGGVCQVSTTLFRTVFWSGLPIVERYPHGYRVAYYEQQSIVGLDATVYRPVVDFRFENDTGHWLLVETETDPSAATATFRLYGTKPAVEVALIGPKITDEEPPPAARVEIDPSLAPGESHVVEHARNGAMVTVTRVITKNGEATSEVFYSRYRPTGEVTSVGPSYDAYYSPDAPLPGEEPADIPPPPGVVTP